MWRFLKLLVLLVIACIVVFVALANVQPVELSFDPTGMLLKDIRLKAPLFMVLFGFVILGVIIGGIGSWFAHTPLRRKKTYYKREMEKAKSELERVRSSNMPMAK